MKGELLIPKLGPSLKVGESDEHATENSLPSQWLPHPSAFLLVSPLGAYIVK